MYIVQIHVTVSPGPNETGIVAGTKGKIQSVHESNITSAHAVVTLLSQLKTGTPNVNV